MGRAIKSVAVLPRTTLTEAAFEQLISYVVNGTWKAGDRLPPERDLCQQFGIARTSLREALKAMELVGMLDSRVGDGTFVCPRSEFLCRPLLWAFTGTDHNELKEIMEARTIIEENLAGLAAERGSADEIAQVGLAVQQMRDSIEAGNSILEADMSFHLAVAAAAHNEVLKNAVQLLRNITRQWLFYKVLIPNVAPAVLKKHESIYKAIAARKPNAARTAMRQHLEETMELVIQVVEQHESISAGTRNTSKSRSH
ncbi:MAG: GntR family transcriptional regulator [Acidobacteriaceae bacterium]|nr:GntR family transcriptional regulator [Acidobacteriaceae bacterium]